MEFHRPLRKYQHFDQRYDDLIKSIGLQFTHGVKYVELKEQDLTEFQPVDLHLFRKNLSDAARRRGRGWFVQLVEPRIYITKMQGE